MNLYCAGPPSGNSPRYPLVIAEVEEKIPALRKRTVTVIDDCQPGLHLTTYGQDPKNVYTADSYKYTLTFNK